MLHSLHCIAFAPWPHTQKPSMALTAPINFSLSSEAPFLHVKHILFMGNGPPTRSRRLSQASRDHTNGRSLGGVFLFLHLIVLLLYFTAFASRYRFRVFRGALEGTGWTDGGSRALGHVPTPASNIPPRSCEHSVCCFFVFRVFFPRRRA